MMTELYFWGNISHRMLQNKAHITPECSLEDLAAANEKARHCARAWPNISPSLEMMDMKEEELHQTAFRTLALPGPIHRPLALR